MASVETKNLIGFQVQMPYGAKRDLDFFLRKTRKGGEEVSEVCIAYGANGVGKSSIANALSKQDLHSVSLRYSEAPSVEVNPAELDNVFVFNQEFIDTNVRAQTHGMSAFVMIGSQVTGQEALDEALEEEAEKKQELDTAKEAEASTGSRNQAARQDLKKSLKDGESWAYRAKEIHESQKNVHEAVVNEIIGSLDEDVKILRDLKDQFDLALDELNELRQSRRCDWNFTNIVDPFDWTAINSIEKMERPAVSISDSRQDLLNRLDEGHSGASAKEALKSFLESSSWCNKCLQDIDPDHSRVIIEMIGLLNSDSRMAESAAKVRALKVAAPTVPHLPSISIDDELKQKYEDSIESVRKEVDHINDLLEQKADSLDADWRHNSAVILEYIERVNEAGSEVNQCVAEHNEKYEKIEDLKSDLDSLNKRIARIECFTQVQACISAKEEFELARQTKTNAEGALHQATNEVAAARAALASHTVACDRINSLLRIVFGDERIKLHQSDSASGGYLVYSHEKRASPSALSTGEVNILALCYFITRISEGRSLSDALGGEKIVILDDPISSFDFDNKYGVLHLLVRLVRENIVESDFGKPNEGTRILFLTHDLSVAYELYKGLATLPSLKIAGMNYKRDSLEGVQFDTIDVYGETLKMIYDFAFVEEVSAEDTQKSFPIADVRRVYEAFVKFHLDFNIGDASTESSIREYFSDAQENGHRLLDAFRSPEFMNAIAHSGGSVQTFNFDLIPPLREADFRRFVKDMILFIHVLSPMHVPTRVERGVSKQSQLRVKLDEEVQRRIDSLSS